ncbi:fumarate reductase [Porphyromonas gulae]|uniref:Fumarate reductase n=1 Tax=Porphyromonas gulae TaxID=111105 RepID=A0A0A2GF83_9PORP|nr:fumarate reductase [Porphyromonas gulae]KGN77343.1 fumarate reductase [Porphyromonas gulae]KGN81014.1 fumarate reductase [Porphyromonas gulae]KGN86822.1 fumarate reductase [Porphyromonas gulae]KGO01919.1 fumarate reductase [Porphyromonas gulae]KGO05160.1 fumarate reductase [Porphyromonas gulae]
MWLLKSSIGRKVVMSVTGLALILFLTFHMSMNLVALFSAEAYNMICEFLGANWYALVASIGLAVLMLLHIVYAFILNAQNLRARGRDRYAVTGRPKGVEWSSQNMLVLGIIVLLGIGLHMFNFWAKMQLAEICHMDVAGFGIEGFDHPAKGTELIRYTFSQPIYVVLYAVWLVALWFHLTHGFWSALQTLGWNNTIWMNRVKCISNVVSTVLVGGFALVLIVFACQAFIG